MKKFPKIVNSDLYANVKDAILVKNLPVPQIYEEYGKRLEISIAYLYQFKAHIMNGRKNRVDSIISELESEGLINAVSEVSLLRAIIAHSSRHIKEATLAQGLEAAKLMLQAKVHLTETAAEKVKKQMAQWFDTEGEAEDVEEVNEIQ